MVLAETAAGQASLCSMLVSCHVVISVSKLPISWLLFPEVTSEAAPLFLTAWIGVLSSFGVGLRDPFMLRSPGGEHCCHLSPLPHPNSAAGGKGASSRGACPHGEGQEQGQGEHSGAHPTRPAAELSAHGMCW